VIDRYRITRSLLKSFKKGATITRACKAAGVGVSTYFYWCAKNPKFAKITGDAINSRITYVEDALYKNCITGSVTAQKYFLNNRNSNKWRDEQPVYVNIEHKTAIFQQIHHNYQANGNGKIEKELHERNTKTSGDNPRGRIQVIE